ncbi:response regulator [Agrobacterium vitis]|uniref:Response regulator n=1 Tax=Agrobacterium vitis TaxID=373 RepID=A0A368P0B2_AGRVI|nr:response regulator [Agrobacterium vitis]KAA3518397.1 response regulator [Agrobacterium vitis]KAA3529994.1 response regulator [Agrobacterium vitis]MCF1465715.1 response regulator [Agrobacterium vitis]MCF1476660.1 response regulator [Agrobacterium vitis]MUZ73511.1 response regulator [Agrobacterium vitis]
MKFPFDLASEARILIIDDEPANIALLEKLLRRERFDRIASTTDPREATALFTEHRTDIILLDLLMPHLDGFALLDRFTRLIGPDDFVPILVLTADVTTETRRRALSLGAKDFLVKPIDTVETVLRIVNLLETRFLFKALKTATLENR